MPPSYILITGATGFIGAHVVSQLLSKGIRVRGTYRSQRKADTMRAHFRSLYGDDKVDSLLDFVYTGDLAAPGCFDEALKGGVEAVVHCASPLNFTLTPEQIINPAIAGTKSLLTSISSTPSIQKLVVLSSFAAVVDEFTRGIGSGVIYTAQDWNPITYEQGISDLRYSYLASKTLSEKEVWEWSESGRGGGVGVVSVCPPLVFGPTAYPIEKISELNSSNAELWFLTTGFSPLPLSPVPSWISIHDLTTALITATLTDSITNKRYTISSPEPFSTQLAADTFRELFDWAKDRVTEGEPGKYPDAAKLEGEIARKELLGRREYIGWKETILEAAGQFKGVEDGARVKVKA